MLWKRKMENDLSGKNSGVNGKGRWQHVTGATRSFSE